MSTTDRPASAARGKQPADNWGDAGNARGTALRTPVFLVASPRPQVGKTFLARLLIDFLQLEGGSSAFDLNPGTGTLADLRPAATARADIATTAGQMALFDRLIVDDDVPKVVDVGHTSFDRFFDVLRDIGFIREAALRGVEPVILYTADIHSLSIEGYARLQGGFASTLLVPVFNEAIAQGRALRDSFPIGRAAAVPVHIPFLPPALKAHAEKSSLSFADFHAALPVDVPTGPAFELRSWTKRTFLEFRELELRLLLEKLKDSLNRP